MIWLFLFLSTGWFALWGSLIAVGGIVVYFLTTDLRKPENKGFEFEKAGRSL
ncbi:MAG: hypothetical protein WDO71_03930 [Bacteroidota bacterium]